MLWRSDRPGSPDPITPERTGSACAYAVEHFTQAAIAFLLVVSAPDNVEDRAVTSVPVDLLVPYPPTPSSP
ncbi:hypothetical protein ACIBSV_46230 [Embleya sp. NPDC050154]|uniref:hypothetical protein n=1 Tax=Embleya sp. NPDC050154 TaxID=3363988 RepID=UPI00378C37C7